MIGYNLEYNLASGSDMSQHYKGSFRNSNFNGFDEIIVPEDVKNKAMVMGKF